MYYIRNYGYNDQIFAYKNVIVLTVLYCNNFHEWLLIIDVFLESSTLIFGLT